MTRQRLAIDQRRQVPLLRVTVIMSNLTAPCHIPLVRLLCYYVVVVGKVLIVLLEGEQVVWWQGEGRRLERFGWRVEGELRCRVHAHDEFLLLGELALV